MQQYIDLGKKLLAEGIWEVNPRTNVKCLTLINHHFEYDVGAKQFPILTTRQVPWKSAIAELLGYLRGCSSAAQFRALGSKSWDANANLNSAWLNNPNRKGEDDMGRVYGVQGRDWKTPKGSTVDQLAKIVKNLSAGIDDRGEILTFWNPGEFDQGCLRPCMYEHQFSIVGGVLHLTSTQRSVDFCLGLAWNMIQAYTLLALMAQITGLKAGKVRHNMVNIHVYENQFELFKEHMERTPTPSHPVLHINQDIENLGDIETWVTLDDFMVTGYTPQPQIIYPFTV